MAKKPKWPADLRKPFPLDNPLAKRAEQLDVSESPVSEFNPQGAENQEFVAEVRRRVSAIAAFVDPLGEGFPATEGDWLRIIYYLCLYWRIPGFHNKKGGRPKKWTDKKREQLFADVMSLVKRGKNEHQACRIIAASPQKYIHGNYPKNHRTLHREFLRAKEAFERRRDPSLTREKAIEMLVTQNCSAAVARAWDPFSIIYRRAATQDLRLRNN
jgi:hypothetical protein